MSCSYTTPHSAHRHFCFLIHMNKDYVSRFCIQVTIPSLSHQNLSETKTCFHILMTSDFVPAYVNRGDKDMSIIVIQYVLFMYVLYLLCRYSPFHCIHCWLLFCCVYCIQHKSYNMYMGLIIFKIIQINIIQIIYTVCGNHVGVGFRELYCAPHPHPV